MPSPTKTKSFRTVTPMTLEMLDGTIRQTGWLLEFGLLSQSRYTTIIGEFNAARRELGTARAVIATGQNVVPIQQGIKSPSHLTEAERRRRRATAAALRRQQAA